MYIKFVGLRIKNQKIRVYKVYIHTYYKTEKTEKYTEKKKKKKRKLERIRKRKNRKKKNKTVRAFAASSLRATRRQSRGRASATSRELDYSYMVAVHRADIRPIYMVYTDSVGIATIQTPQVFLNLSCD